MDRTASQIVIRIQADDFDGESEIAALIGGRADIGAVVAFTGLCRADGDDLAALELEHYPGMAEAEIRRIAEEACQRWPLHGVVAIHRYGRIAPGERIVLVAATSSHRQAAFDGANFVMDFLKTEAPFWKKEHRTDGTSGDWVSAKDADDEARKRWADS
ncbi:molybdenum cofactor biosynthesis protein MoaE [Notoacmeibacter marinus]|uniref:molybdenum cofactor biosynthesis protein MoaE n=1 Tax=Notoacmeibacter marinus TaxID=1876515 RepID=UPI000DF3AF11|nr:molybdenum cofactor biosynthesis protein MoaE [Notoacmeibacter marinus]